MSFHDAELGSPVAAALWLELLGAVRHSALARRLTPRSALRSRRASAWFLSGVRVAVVVYVCARPHHRPPQLASQTGSSPMAAAMRLTRLATRTPRFPLRHSHRSSPLYRVSPTHRRRPGAGGFEAHSVEQVTGLSSRLSNPVVVVSRVHGEYPPVGVMLDVQLRLRLLRQPPRSQFGCEQLLQLLVWIAAEAITRNRLSISGDTVWICGPRGRSGTSSRHRRRRPDVR